MRRALGGVGAWEPPPHRLITPGGTVLSFPEARVPVERSSSLIVDDRVAESSKEEEGGAVTEGLEEPAATRRAGGGGVLEAIPPPPRENTPEGRGSPPPEAVSLLEASPFLSYFAAAALGVGEEARSVVRTT